MTRREALGLALALAAARRGRSAAAAEFSFAQASDLHVNDTKSLEIVNDAVDRINADPRVRCSLWLGDLTTNNAGEELLLARAALRRLRQPWYAVRGNHDLGRGTFEEVIGPLMQRIDLEDWTFLLCDSNPGDAVPMAAAQVAWLRDQVAAIEPQTPLVLACHHPLLQSGPYRLAGADEVLGLFARHNLRAVLNAHFHGNVENRRGELLQTTTACLSTTRGNHDGTKVKGYRLWHVSGETIRTEFVPVREA
ncbi:MAG: metallophosphoesterase [Fimbriimonadaceae bacterium]|nr:metallophosphoesterase [Fimbriimonadaceae bacterium]